jgi:hypothetical protein
VGPRENWKSPRITEEHSQTARVPFRISPDDHSPFDDTPSYDELIEQLSAAQLVIEQQGR